MFKPLLLTTVCVVLAVAKQSSYKCTTCMNSLEGDLMLALSPNYMLKNSLPHTLQDDVSSDKTGSFSYRGFPTTDGRLEEEDKLELINQLYHVASRRNVVKRSPMGRRRKHKDKDRRKSGLASRERSGGKEKHRSRERHGSKEKHHSRERRGSKEKHHSRERRCSKEKHRSRERRGSKEKHHSREDNGSKEKRNHGHGRRPTPARPQHPMATKKSDTPFRGPTRPAMTSPETLPTKKPSLTTPVTSATAEPVGTDNNGQEFFSSEELDPEFVETVRYAEDSGGRRKGLVEKLRIRPATSTPGG